MRQWFQVKTSAISMTAARETASASGKHVPRISRFVVHGTAPVRRNLNDPSTQSQLAGVLGVPCACQKGLLGFRELTSQGLRICHQAKAADGIDATPLAPQTLPRLAPPSIRILDHVLHIGSSGISRDFKYDRSLIEVPADHRSGYVEESRLFPSRNERNGIAMRFPVYVVTG